MEQELRRLTFRSFLYQLWPENAGTLAFDDPGPYYFLNRQACPVVERLEGMAPQSLPFGAYVTSLSQVREFYLERDSRLMDVIVAMREGLYRRNFSIGEREVAAHLGIEHWYAPVQLHCELTVPGHAEPVHFAPSALIGMRLESRDGALSTLLPMWFEYDRGTEDVESTVEEVLRYANYYGSDEYRRRFPRLAEQNNPGPLIVLCEDAYRREEVAAALRSRLGGRSIPVYFSERPTLLHDPYAEDLLVSVAAGGERYALLDRLLAHNKPLLDRRVFAGTDRLTDPLTSQLAAETPASSASPKPPPDLSAWSQG
jgi:hypothetical protein